MTLAAQNGLGSHLHFHSQRPAPHLTDGSVKGDDLAHMRGLVKTYIFAGGSDERRTAVTAGSDEGDPVHIGQTGTAEECAMVVGVARKDDLQQSGDRGWRVRQSFLP